MAEILFYYIVIGLCFSVALTVEYVRNYCRRRVRFTQIAAIIIGSALVTATWPIYIMVITRLWKEPGEDLV